MRPALSSIAVGVSLAALLLPLPAQACSINLTSSGALRASMDNTMLGSEVNGTTPATLTTILSALDGTVTVDVAPPTRTQTPSGYNANAEILQVAYVAPSVLGLFGGASHGYTSSITSFQAGLLGAVTFTLTVNNRILNPNGFAPGTYSTRTVITCHP